MKRVWTEARAVPAEGGFSVMLDGKILKIPGGTSLIVPFEALAGAIAAEWGRAGLDGRDIRPDDLPLTRLATTAIGRVSLVRDEIITALAAYGLHDLLCYRAETPAALAKEEAEHWQPWLDWAARAYDVPLNIGTGITPVPQPSDTQPKFAAALERFDDFQLTVLGVAVPALGSLILGLALATGALTSADALRLATVDEVFQERKWGTDADGARARDVILADLSSCVRFMALCR